MRGAGVGWHPCGYVHGDGLRLTAGDRVIEVVPYVLGPGGIVAGYAIEIDGARSGFTRVPGPIEQAVAIAELMLTDPAMRWDGAKSWPRSAESAGADARGAGNGGSGSS
jgi:hypothetical protein